MQAVFHSQLPKRECLEAWVDLGATLDIRSGILVVGGLPLARTIGEGPEDNLSTRSRHFAQIKSNTLVGSKIHRGGSAIVGSVVEGSK